MFKVSVSTLHFLVGVHVAEDKRIHFILDCPITPVGSPLFFVQNKSLVLKLCLLPQDLHSLILGHFIFIPNPLEETTHMTAVLEEDQAG